MPRLPTATATSAPAGRSIGLILFNAAVVAATTSLISGARARTADTGWRDGSGTGGRLFGSISVIVLNLKGGVRAMRFRNRVWLLLCLAFAFPAAPQTSAPLPATPRRALLPQSHRE